MGDQKTNQSKPNQTAPRVEPEHVIEPTDNTPKLGNTATNVKTTTTVQDHQTTISKFTPLKPTVSSNSTLEKKTETIIEPPVTTKTVHTHIPEGIKTVVENTVTKSTIPASTSVTTVPVASTANTSTVATAKTASNSTTTSIPNFTPKPAAGITTPKSMIAKTEVKTVNNDEKSDENPIAKLIGIGIIIFGILLLLGMFLLIIFTRISPRVDSSIPIPTIKGLSEYTNQEKIKIEGDAKGVSEVMIFIDDNETKTSSVNKDGQYSLEYTMTKEKKYKFEVAGLKGSILRSRSEKSSPVYTTFDKTAPSANIDLTYNKEVTDSNFTVKGKAEADTVVTFKKGDKSYSVNTDNDGNFEVKGIVLDKGSNEFSIEIKDLAGNSTVANKKLVVTYTTASINGNGASTTTSSTTIAATAPTLPNSAGVLDDAMAIMMQNKFMFVFGIFALFLLLGNSGMVMLKVYGERKRN